MKDVIRIANAGGFWGDDLTAFRRQLTLGKVDYISMDFLAEITMSILAKQQIKDPKLGYVYDFIDQISENAELLAEKGVKVITNAGGINPAGCAEKVIEILKEKNINLKVGIVEGDNLIDDIKSLQDNGAKFENLETAESFELIEDRLISANAYLGVQPIVDLLKQGADIIICGRVTDTSVTMAPMIYEYDWELNDWDKLASAVVAAHIIECGAQATGGNFTDWYKVTNWNNFGYPIIEVSPDGSFNVTKHQGTGGLVSVDTVREQLVYEMGDPEQYISPDVIADFSSINIRQVDDDVVNVSCVKGYPSTTSLKISMAYEDGFKASSSIIISGPYAINKANKFAEIFWKRLDVKFEKTNTELVGYDSCHKNLVDKDHSNEVLLKFSVYDKDKDKIKKFSNSIAPLILTGPPGVAVTGGRPRAQSVMTYWPALIEKKLIQTNTKLFNEENSIEYENSQETVTGFEEEILYDFENDETETGSNYFIASPIEVKIEELCLARSGDKGNTVNVGVLARSKKIYDFIKIKFDEQFMKDTFCEFCYGKVKRYELDNLLALNFLLENSLDGGGTKSLMIDSQGKTFAQALLNQKILVPKNIIENLES